MMNRQNGRPACIGEFLWQALPEGSEKYQAYLCSREWAERRNAVYLRCGSVCERCNMNAADHVHHLTYVRKYAELPEDLQALCRGCHEFTHGKSDVDPAKPPIVWDLKQLLSAVPFGEADCSIDRYATLCCPVCRFEYSHIREVFTEQSEGADEAGEPGEGYRGTQGRPGPPGWRRRSLVVVFDGECGHAWRLVIQQHKGVNYARVETDKDGDSSLFNYTEDSTKEGEP